MPRLLVICLGAVTLVIGCSREPTTGNGGSADSTAEAAGMSGIEFTNRLPHAGGPAGYVGSQSCQECHEDQYASWHRSYHRTMTQIATPATVQADFHNVIITNDGTRFHLTQRSNELWVRFESVLPVAPGEPRSEPVDARISLFTGSHHMQVFWVPNGQGNTQLGFPLTWLIPERRWVPRNSTFLRPPDTIHRPEVWNVVCSRCHATAPEPRIDSATVTIDTRVGELGIACEACHGPGENHTRARLAALGSKSQPEAGSLRQEIIHPAKIDPGRASQVCGFCHSMKWFQSAEWPRTGFHYRPGDDLEATTPIIRPSRVESVPGLASFLNRNPDLLRDFFWSDGMIRVSGRDYNGLLESPCYRGGNFSCLSCHSMHESEPVHQLARNRLSDQACVQCHERFEDTAQITRHSHHRAGSTGSQCYNCHMPHTTYGVLKAIRSHQVSSPRVADELSTGRPNACNLCHLDKTLAWTAGHLHAWFQQPLAELAREHTEVADSVRLALSGDAGQRVLIAWHFGWEAARQTAGDSWIAPLLGQLLDDPYAAVRCVAERSLKQFPGASPAAYDYSINVHERIPVREAVWSTWLAGQNPDARARLPDSTLVNRGDTAELRQRIEALVKFRNDRPVRLRE